MLVFYSAFTHSTNVRVRAQNLFGFHDGDGVLPRQLFNELVFPNDFPDDHDEKSYHSISAKNRFNDLSLLADLGVSFRQAPLVDYLFAFFAGARFEVSRSI